MILEQLGLFWSNTEVVLDLLTKKGQHVEQFIGFSSKPRLLARFKERMEEYKRFWEGIQMMASNYLTGVQNPNDRQKMYEFLDKNQSLSSAESPLSTYFSPDNNSKSSMSQNPRGSQNSSRASLDLLGQSTLSPLF